MLFNSLQFVIFFIVTLVIYFIVPKKIRHIWLLICNYVFYMSWNAKYAVLLVISTTITYLCGILLEKENNYTNNATKKKLILLFGLLSNLGILFFFKYFDFTIQNLNFVLNRMHVAAIPKIFDLLLPVGISFYTFQVLGYIIDIYRQESHAENNIVYYALFVSFFPLLIAGPIERFKKLSPQLHNIASIKLWNAKRISNGAILMLWGYFLKMVIADRVAILVDTVFSRYEMYGSTALIAAAVGFTLQIYCDFSSYSSIAIGAAEIIGITLTENFNTPYFAESIQDFWRRWHISLSSWLKDYVYIPLGGNRCSKARHYINIMLTFLVSGIWHGANWTYVVWGGLHGIYQIIGKMLEPLRTRIIKVFQVKTDCFSFKFTRIVGTFILTSIAWIFFRAASIGDACFYIIRIFTRRTPWNWFNGYLYTLGIDRPEMNVLIFAMLLLVLVDFVRYRKRQTIGIFLQEQNFWFSWFCIIGMVVFIYIFGVYGPNYNPQQFIYSHF